MFVRILVLRSINKWMRVLHSELIADMIQYTHSEYMVVHRIREILANVLIKIDQIYIGSFPNKQQRW